MDTNSAAYEWLHLVFRWIHVLAGIMWIGHLWFFNFVNSQFAKAYDADSKKKLLPELMPRALYWFRWGAAFTWITGILLLGLIYYMGGVMVANMPGSTALGTGALTAISLGILVVAWPIYDMGLAPIFKKNEMAGTAVALVLTAALAFGLRYVMSGRAMMIQIGATYGTLMAANVWMRIWPGQRKIIAGVKGTGPAPDPAIPATAGLRSKHNTYMSVPLVFAMISNHFSTIVGSDWNWLIITGAVVVGWLMAKRVYGISAGTAPSYF